MICDICHVEMKPFDRVRRIVRTKGRRTHWVYVRRAKCPVCSQIRRVLPSYIMPYKQYEKAVIFGVVEGLIDAQTLGFEDYPCEMTMKRWRFARFPSHIMKGW